MVGTSSDLRRTVSAIAGRAEPRTKVRKESMKSIFMVLVLLATIFAGLSPAKADDFFNINWSFTNPDGTTVSDSLNFCTGC
jgi:hypothetical protein